MSGLGSQILVLIFLCLAVVGSERQVDHQQSPHQQQDHLKDTGPFSHHTGTNTDTSHRDTLKTSDNNNNMKQKPSEAVIQAFETSLLQMFGLKHRPKPKRKDKIHIPEYLMELYRQHTGDPDRTSINFNVKNTDTLSANTIRSFSHIDKEDRDRGRLKHRGKLAQEDSENSHIKHLYFNTSSIPGEETLTAAQLRLFRHNNYSKTDYESLSQFGLQKHRIEIYEVLRPGSSWREPITRLLDTKLVDPKDLSWEELDVKPAVLKWLESPHLNHGLQVHFVTEAGAPSKLQHVRLRRSLDMDDRQWSREQPTLLTFGDDGKTASKVRTKRGARHRKRDRSHLKKRRKDECKRHELYVDFSDVGWDDWIVAPPGYQAYYCHGECSFPLPEYINATNHAIVQTLVHSVDPQAIPRPCCVPTELSPISMLYLDEYEKVVLKNYQDMVVIGCGCR